VTAIVESDVLDFLEKGAVLEQELLGELKANIPDDIAGWIPTVPAPVSQSSSSNAALSHTYSRPTASAAAPVATAPAVATGRGSPASTSANGAAAGLRQAAYNDMPEPDTRSAAVLLELQTAVKDVRVRCHRVQL
jgi:hypothetical protein